MPTLSRRTLLVVALAVAAASFAALLVEPFDPDMFHHLALGRAIAASGLRPDEQLLYPVRGAISGPAPYWLGSLAIYAWSAAFGTNALALLPAAVGALLILVLLADSAPRGGRHSAVTLAAAALPLALAVAAFRHRAMARPELFAIVLLALTAWAIRRFEEGHPRLLLAFPLIAALWANVHFSAIAGAGLVAVLAAVGAAEHGLRRAFRRAPPPGALSSRQLALAAGIALVGLLATAVSPSGTSPIVGAVDLVLSTLGVGAGSSAPAGASMLELIRRNVVEMAPPEAADWVKAPGLLLILTALSFGLAAALPPRTIRWREVVTFVAFLVLATRAYRFMVLFAVVSAPFAARNLGAALAAIPARIGRVPWRTCVATLAALAALAALPLGRDPLLRFGTPLRRGAYPVRALDYLAAIGFDGKLYNSFETGGYVEWRGFPAFQDGRGFLPAGTEMAALSGPVVRSTFEELDARFRFDALVLPPLFEHARTAPLRPGDDWYADRSRWALVAFDDGGVLFLRRDGKYAAQAARDEYAWARPSMAPYEWPRALVGRVLEDYRRSVAEAPECALCRFYLASAAMAAGLAEEALQAAAPVLDGDDIQVPDVLPVAASAAEALGRLDVARAHAERLLALRPGHPAALRILERLAAARDRGARSAEARALLEQGVAAYRAGDLAGAIPLLEAAARTEQPNPAAHSNLGYVYLDLGRLDDSVREQRTAIAQAPGFGAAHYGLGLALAARGDRDGAAQALREYLRIEPGGRWAAKASQRVAELERR